MSVCGCLLPPLPRFLIHMIHVVLLSDVRVWRQLTTGGQILFHFKWQKLSSSCHCMFNLVHNNWGRILENDCNISLGPWNFREFLILWMFFFFFIFKKKARIFFFHLFLSCTLLFFCSWAGSCRVLHDIKAASVCWLPHGPISNFYHLWC